MAAVGQRHSKAEDAEGRGVRQRRGRMIAGTVGAIWAASLAFTAAEPAVGGRPPVLRATPVFPLHEQVGPPAPVGPPPPPAPKPRPKPEPKPKAAPKERPRAVKKESPSPRLRRVSKIDAPTPPAASAPKTAEGGPEEESRDAGGDEGGELGGTAGNRVVPEEKRAMDYAVFHGWTRPLSEYFRGNEAVMLRHHIDRKGMDVSIPWRVMNPQIGVLLRSQSSGVLDPARSQVALRWNGRTFAQELIGEGGESENLAAELALPEMAGPENRFEIAVVQGRLEGDGDPFHPELWTQLLPHQSMLTLSFQLRPLRGLTLDRIPDLIDSRWWKSFEICLLTPEPEEMSPKQVDWMSQVSQRVALCLGETPLEVSHVTGIRDRGDHIAIGTRSELASILPKPVSDLITESFFGVFPHPGNPGFFLLVLSGSDAAGVERAVEAFLDENLILPPKAFVDLSGFSIASGGKPESDWSPAMLEPGREHRFSQLGYETIEGDGMDDGDYTIRFRLPPGLRTLDSAKAKLSLKMDWSPVREGSVVDIRLNGESVEEIEIGEIDPAGLGGHGLRLPMRLFTAGENVLTLVPDLRPDANEGSVEGKVASPRFVIGGDSSIEFPGASQLLSLPDLSLMSRGAVPAANVRGSGERFVVWPSSGDSHTLGAACTIIGKLAQVAGGCLSDVRLSFQLPEPGDHFLAVGDVKTIGGKLAPRKIVDREPGGAISVAALGGEELAREMAGSGLICQFESPLSPGRIGMLLTAAEGRELEEQVKQLVRPETWSELSGDTFAWRADSGQRMTLDQFPEFTIENGGALENLWFFLLSRPWWAAAGAAVIIFLIGWRVSRSFVGSDAPVCRLQKIENRPRRKRQKEGPFWDRGGERPA